MSRLSFLSHTTRLGELVLYVLILNIDSKNHFLALFFRKRPHVFNTNPANVYM